MKLNDVINESHIGKKFKLIAKDLSYEFTGEVTKESDGRLKVRDGWKGYIVGNYDIWKEIIEIK